MGIAAAIEIGADAAIGAGVAEAGALGAEATFAGGLAEAGAEATFAGGAAEAGAEATFAGGFGEAGAEAAFAGGAAGALDSSVASALGAEGGVSPDALSEGSSGEFSDVGFSGSSEAFNDIGLSGVGGEEALLSGQGFDEAGFSDVGASNVEDFSLTEGGGDGQGPVDEPLQSTQGFDEQGFTEQGVLGQQTNVTQPATEATQGEQFQVNKDPYNADQQGQATGQQAGGKAGGAGQFNPGQLLNALRQLASGPSRPASLGQGNAAATAIQTQGQALLDAYNSGQLSAPMMANLKSTLQANLSKLRQQFRSAGTFNSSMRVQAENQVFLQATASMADALQKELAQGLAALGQAGQLFLQQAQVESANDRAFNSSLGNALGSILRMPFSGGAGGGNSGGGQGQLAQDDGSSGGSEENISEAA